MSILDMNFFKFLGFKKRPKAPWSKFYKKRHLNINVPNSTIYEYLTEHSKRHENNIAIEYMGTKIKYKDFINKIDEASNSFRSYGIRKGDVVSILSANVPEALISFYALNKIGAVANMLPLIPLIQ